MTEQQLQNSEIQFEDISPWTSSEGDTGLSARLKLKRNFDKIKTWINSVGSMMAGGGTLSVDLTANFSPNVGYVASGRQYPAGTLIEDVIRDILYKDIPASLTVTYSPSQPLVGQTITITANFSAGSSDLTVVSYQWYKDGELIEGATGSAYTDTADSAAHSYYCVATLSDDSEVRSDTVSVTGSVNVATMTVSISADEAEVGDTVTVTAAITAGTTATQVQSITIGGQTVTPVSGTLTYSRQVTVTEGAKTIAVAVTMNDSQQLSGSVRVTGYYKWFAGKVSIQNAGDVNIASLERSGFIKSSTFAIPDFKVNNWRCIALAVPATKGIAQFHAVTDGFTSDMLSDGDYMTTATKQYRGVNYGITDVFADASTNESTIKIILT